MLIVLKYFRNILSHFDVLKEMGEKCALIAISVGVLCYVKYPSLAYLTPEAVMGLLIRESPWFMPSLRHKIIVFSKRYVVEMGNYRPLLSKHGTYYEMCYRQSFDRTIPA